jgi:RND superfamily putative drug exporter
MARAGAQLSSGLSDLASGSDALSGGIARTAAGAALLAGGVERFGAGTVVLDQGIGQLRFGPDGSGGAEALAGGLRQAAAGTGRLARGLRRLFDRVIEVRRSAQGDIQKLRRSGADITTAASSGYLVLAGIEGSKPQTRINVGFATNGARGGDAARIEVVPKDDTFDPKTIALRPLIEAEADKTARELGGGRALVGGLPVIIDDFDIATSTRLPILAIALALVTFLVLVVMFRSPVLALCAVLSNLISVGAAVGMLVIFFQGDSPILGGPGFLDALSLSSVFVIIFGLSIDYQVFLISRLLEGHELTGTTEGAVRHCLVKTATIVTGAAAIMAGVFLAFAISPVTNTRQLGVGLTTAVLLDATVIRLILFPALIRVFGERTWAVPAWLDRMLPRFATH